MDFQPWWIDVALVTVAILYAIDGFRRGFLLVFIEVIGFSLSLLIALVGYPWVAKVLLSLFSIPHSFANAIAFFLLWIAVGLTYPILAREGYHRIPDHVVNNPMNRYLGFIPALADAFVLAAVILPLLIALPLSAPIKSGILKSSLGAPIANFSERLDAQIESIFSPVVRDSLAFMTIHPKSNESVNLKFSTKDHTVDEESETAMFADVNRERLARGEPILVQDAKLRDLARRYGEAMIEGGFFSHVGKDGSSPASRATAAYIVYSVIGENLAFAPDESYAHNGLMNSEGHRANILSKDYHKLGVGVIDAGMYGKVFVQEFSD
jgi:uncharacterized protein YkwD